MYLIQSFRLTAWELLAISPSNKRKDISSNYDEQGYWNVRPFFRILYRKRRSVSGFPIWKSTKEWMLGNTLPSPGHLDSANNINRTFCQRERKTFLRDFFQRQKEVGIKTKEKKICIETVVQINHGIGLVFVFFAKNHFYFITALFIEHNFTFDNFTKMFKPTFFLHPL